MSSGKIRQFEGSVRIKGYNIAYILWLPSIEQEQASLPKQQPPTSNNPSSKNSNSSSSNSNSNVIKYMSNIDPIALSSHYKHTMLCVHGWLDNAMSYCRIGPLLCQRYSNLRIIAIDWPGHGKSSHSPVGYYDRSLFAVTIIRFLHKIGCYSNIHLMGHSMGAVYLPYIVPLLQQNANNISNRGYGNGHGNGNINGNGRSTDWFDIQSLICLEQFGATRSRIEFNNQNLATLKHLLPTPEEQFEEELDSSNNGDNLQGGGASGTSSGGGNSSGSRNESFKHLPKLYDSIDEIVNSRVWVTKEIYPGNQWIDEQSARMILERNVGSVTVVETDNDIDTSNNNNNSNRRRKRQRRRKYFLRTDVAWRNSSADPVGRLWPVNLKSMYEKLVPKIKCPIMAVFAENGWPLLDSVAVFCKDKLKIENLEIARVGGSHHVHIDTPILVMEKIGPFLDNIIEISDDDANENKIEYNVEMEDSIASNLRRNNTSGHDNVGQNNDEINNNHRNSNILIKSKL